MERMHAPHEDAVIVPLAVSPTFIVTINDHRLPVDGGCGYDGQRFSEYDHGDTP
jgi:hypothetical protein